MTETPGELPVKPPAPCGDEGDPCAPAGTGTAALCQLVLVKQDQKFVFRYEPGQEARLLEVLVELARDPDSDLDWFDAAVLSHQMGRQMSQEIDAMLKP